MKYMEKAVSHFNWYYYYLLPLRPKFFFFQIFISFLYFLSGKILCLFTHVSNGVVAVFKLMGMTFKH